MNFSTSIGIARWMHNRLPASVAHFETLRATVGETVDQILARLREGNKIERIAREILELVEVEIKVASFLYNTVVWQPGVTASGPKRLRRDDTRTARRLDARESHQKNGLKEIQAGAKDALPLIRSAISTISIRQLRLVRSV